VRKRTLVLMQPRAFVVPPATRLALLLLALPAVGAPTIAMRIPRTPWPASVTQAETTANVLPPRLWRLAVIVSRTGSRTNDVLCAVLGAFGIAVPGVYGTKTPFHA
jgi:hypothetical protein